MDGINKRNESFNPFPPEPKRAKSEEASTGAIMGRDVTVRNTSEPSLPESPLLPDTGKSTVTHVTSVEETTRAIERYLKDSSGKEPLNKLGMTAEGRIVRLAEQDECHQPKLRRVLEQQFAALLPTAKGKSFWKPEVKNTLSTEFKTLLNFRNRIQRDRQIRNRLMELEKQYASEFEKLDKLTTTKITVLDEAITKGSNQPGEPFAQYMFKNEFTQSRWAFSDNRKSGAIKPRDFYMSNVIARQFKLSFDSFGWLLELPEIIDREMITNQKTIEILLEHKKDYGSDAFKTAFLETTVNGKSTVNVARDLGLIIERITVSYHHKLVERIDESITDKEAYKWFDVHVHVRPNEVLYDPV
ncbi:hypothetical protein [Endozoicomonas sp. ALB032]|uniref:hypothetical protein n=1 Tax=Endozoicomonas sp. ALB032 TaxID=3403082 RepID=UPI003BB4CE5C